MDLNFNLFFNVNNIIIFKLKIKYLKYFLYIYI